MPYRERKIIKNFEGDQVMNVKWVAKKCRPQGRFVGIGDSDSVHVLKLRKPDKSPIRTNLTGDLSVLLISFLRLRCV
jgi:hypothetical protein